MYLKPLPDGVHHPNGVVYLARLAGLEGDHLPRICIFGEEMGFSEVTAFVKTSDERGHYQTTLNECSCLDWQYRRAGTGQMCKHQKALCEALRRKEEAHKAPSLPCGVVGMAAEELEARKARIVERNRQRAVERAHASAPSMTRGFNLPDEVRPW